MSRIIVKDLPKKVTEDEVKNFFSEVGPITDVKLKYKGGLFRRYCFIGYESEEAAQKAETYFKNAYFKQSKIIVNISDDLNAESKSSAKIKAKKAIIENTKKEDSISESKKEPKKKKKEKDKPVQSDLENDADFKEYVKLNTKKSELFQNNSEVDVVESDDEEEEEKDEKIAVKNDVSDLDYLKSLQKNSEEVKAKTGYDKNKNWVDLHTVVIRLREGVKRNDNKGKVLTKKNIKEFMKPLKMKSLRIPRHDTTVAFVGFKLEKDMKQALQKDLSFIDGSRVKVQYHHPETNEDSTLRDGEAPWAAAVERLQNAEPVAETGKLFVRNLWYSATEDNLKEFFEKIGPVSDITVPLCKVTRKSKGFAHVTFVFPEHAVKTMNELDGKSFKGRILHILPSLKKDESLTVDENDTFKDKKLKQQKATATSWHNWNSLFMSSSAVLDLMSEKYGRSKQEILNDEGDQSAAVNLALGEAQLVDECKRFLESADVCLDSFSDPSVQRSSTVILVKNLPALTTAGELEEIFGKYGELGRVVLPPSGVTGLVEYLDPGEAKKGFRMLAYSKFKYLPLYLEWAPVKVFKSSPKNSTKFDIDAVNICGQEDSEEKTKVIDEEKKELEHDPEPNTTLYVKNLNFKTQEDAIKLHFSQMGTICTVLIAKKRDLSQGYGFVQYLKTKSAKNALRELQDSYLDGFNIQLKLSEKVITEPSNKRKLQDIGKQQTSKIMVKNIPFHATQKEISQLFKTFGELKLVRLPVKPGQQEHRGFGFVEFVTKEDAKKAFDSLGSSSHLYGRRLVLEWAKEEESVDELRRKTADHFLSANTRGPPTKKSRVDVDNIGPIEKE